MGALRRPRALAGLAAADRLAKRYGLIPPDDGGVYGPGETLTYACQRLLTANTPAREFPRSMISKKPFANAVYPPPTERSSSCRRAASAIGGSWWMERWRIR